MNFRDYELPDTLLYNKDSSWIKLDGNYAYIGVIEPVCKVLKEFLFIKLPELGKIQKGEVYVSLETLKWSGHLKSPLTGVVEEVNESLFDEPERINEDPYGSWIAKIKIENTDELEDLFKPEEIISWLESTLDN